MTKPLIETLSNPAREQGAPVRLSVLIPFYKDDPCALISALAEDAPEGVEFIAFDDGRPDTSLNEAVAACVMALSTPAALIVSRLNRGRSAARNHLAAAARGEWMLFLDADMAASPGFLTRWLLAMENTAADILFGGYAPVEPTAETRVHARLAALSDRLGAVERSRIGATAVCSSNLAARRSVLASVPFEEAYVGWGWEDVDWALSASKAFTVAHIDNPAGHAGLESVDKLLAKFSRSGPNFQRLLRRHPDYAARPGARLALMLHRFKLGSAARFAGEATARAPLPAFMQVIGLKLFRAGVGAGALSR